MNNGLPFQWKTEGLRITDRHPISLHRLTIKTCLSTAGFVPKPQAYKVSILCFCHGQKYDFKQQPKEKKWLSRDLENPKPAHHTHQLCASYSASHSCQPNPHHSPIYLSFPSLKTQCIPWQNNFTTLFCLKTAAYLFLFNSLESNRSDRNLTQNY